MLNALFTNIMTRIALVYAVREQTSLTLSTSHLVKRLLLSHTQSVIAMMTTIITIVLYVKCLKGSGKMSKYHNKIAYTADGIKHASQKEANRWCELKMLERVGAITDLKRQVEYELLPPQEGERKVTYVADFVYTDDKGNTIVEDTKGVKTEVYILKRKLMLWVHNIRIHEV